MFCVGSRVQQETPEEGRRTHRPKCVNMTIEDEDNCPNTLKSDKNYQASSQNFTQIKRGFFQAATMYVLLYGSTTCTLTKLLEKKLDGNYTMILRALLDTSRKQHSTKQQLHGHLPYISKTIQGLVWFLCLMAYQPS